MSQASFTRGKGVLEEFLAKKRANIVKKLIPKKHFGGRVLDIGCGTYPYFLAVSGFSEKYGIDYSTDVSKIEDKTITIKKGNVEKSPLPFRENFFDAVVMLAVFEHINKEKLDFVLKEVRKVLKKDGYFVITTPAPWSDPVLHFASRVGLISSEEIHDHKHNFSHESITKMLIESGFDSNKIKRGFFELGFNMWFSAIK